MLRESGEAYTSDFAGKIAKARKHCFLGPNRRKSRYIAGSDPKRTPLSVMMILALVRNYLPAYEWVKRGGWNIADCVERSYDLEGMHVGTVAAGRIGLAVLRRLKPFEVNLHYFQRHRLPQSVEKELGLTFHSNVEEMVKVCDIVTINAPLPDQRLSLPRTRKIT